MNVFWNIEYVYIYIYMCVCVCVCVPLCVLVTQSCLTLCDCGLYLARFLCPRDSLGKNTGAGNHALL